MPANTQSGTARGRRTAWARWAAVGSALTLLAGVFCACAAEPDELATYRQTVRKQYPTVRQLSTAALAQWLSDTNRAPPVLLDVREPAEFRVSHLKGARLYLKTDSARGMAARLEPDTPIVVYCSVGARSSQLATELQRAGFTKICNLDGSIFQWANEGRPVFSGTNPVARVHPYDREWGRFLKTDLIANPPSGK